MKSNSEKKKFRVLNWDFNKDEIEYYDVLPYFRKKLEERIEKSKNDKNNYFKVPKSFDELKKFIEDESMYHFWSRCEYEMIVHGWPVRKKDHKIDIHEQIMMNIDLICEILFDEYAEKILQLKVEKEKTHEYVDLGLPSGTLWAKHNIQDADGNELYFAWGETQGYTSGQVGTDKYFIFEDYKYGTFDFDDEPNYGMTKYNKTDGKAVLDADDDAATVNWGSDWKMPTKEQFDELTANTTTAWTRVDGVNGLLCTSKANNNTLFFPAVGRAADGKVISVGGYGSCWSVSLGDGGVYGAWELYFGDGYCGVVRDYRYYGRSVRPVRVIN